MNILSLLMGFAMAMLVSRADGETPDARLWPAIRKGDAKTLRELLTADRRLVQARMEAGTSPVLFAVYAGHAELVPLFREFGAALDFFEASACGDLDVMKQRLGEKPELLNRPARDGYGALGLAIFFGHDEAARWLMKQGADVNLAAANAARPAPIHSATARDNRGMIALLLEHGADPDRPQGQGFTALHEAAARGNREIVQLLLKHGASKSARTEDGRTAADLARERGHAEVAALVAE